MTWTTHWKRCASSLLGCTSAAGRSSKKLLKQCEDGEALNGAKDQAVPAEADLEAQTVQSGTKKGMILPFIRLAITFKDIHYYVPMPEVRPHNLAETVTASVGMPKAVLCLGSPCVGILILAGSSSS